MSEPIQSIAQNNYILATQQEVSHDNTLSGNGTVDSPLGLNETVLWEDSTGIAAINETAALSESIANFESVAIYSEPIYGGALIRNEFNVADLPYRFSTMSLDGNNVYIAQYNVTISTTTVTVSRSRRVSITYAGAVTTTDLSATGSYKAPIRKIVGINRKAQ